MIARATNKNFYFILTLYQFYEVSNGQTMVNKTGCNNLIKSINTLFGIYEVRSSWLLNFACMV